MKLPPIGPRGDVLYADFRQWKGPRHVCLDLPVGSPDLEVGIAVGRKLEAFRLAGQIQSPELPGLERKTGQTLGDVILLHADSREYDTDDGEDYARGVYSRIARDLGNFELAALDGHSGDVILLRWKEQLWARGLGGHTVRNYIKQLFRVLRWAQSRRLLVALPEEPQRLSPEGRGPVYVPKHDHWTEGDFRKLREGWAEDCLRAGRWSRTWPRERQLDEVGMRSLLMSTAYYTGLHTYELERWPAWWFSRDMGRYRRENHKSAACIRPAVFDMPEQLQIDVEAEYRRCYDAGRPWRDDDLVLGGPWKTACVFLNRATLRLWPDERTRPCHFDFRSITRKSCAWEYCVRGWSAESIAEILGHIDRQMVDAVYRRCDELGLISAVRIPWRLGSAPGGQARTGSAKVLDFRR